MIDSSCNRRVLKWIRVTIKIDVPSMKASIIPPEGNAKLGRSCYDFNELGYPQVPPNREKKCCGIPLTRNTSKVLQHLEVTGALIFIENPTLKHSKRMKIPGIVKHNLQKKKRVAATWVKLLVCGDAERLSTKFLKCGLWEASYSPTTHHTCTVCCDLLETFITWRG